MTNDPSLAPPLSAPSPVAHGTIARADRLAALGYAVQGAVVLALIGLTILGAERLVLSHPARLGPEIDGFPTDRVVTLQASTAGRIVMLGDSVIQTVASSDTDTRMLPVMVSERLDGRDVTRISQAATGIDLYLAYLRYMERAPVPPSAVIVEINPRSFSPHWEQNPGWIFDDVAASIEHPLFARFASVLEWQWTRPTYAEFEATPVWIGDTVAGTVGELEDLGAGWDPPEAIARQRYLVRYGADYARSRRIVAMRALVDEANACAFPVVLYLTPIDVEAARARLPPEGLAALDRNLVLLRAELSRARQWPVVDASELVAAADFDHPPGDPHEHLKARGREQLAEVVAAALQSVDAGAH